MTALDWLDLHEDIVDEFLDAQAPYVDKLHAHRAKMSAALAHKRRLAWAAYYATHREELCAKARAWWAANRDRVRANHRAWRAKNPDKLRVYRERRREPMREYRKRNAAKRATYLRAWRAKKRAE